jgi:hypothetical protein
MLASAALGSTTLNQWIPGSSPGAPTIQSTPEERPIFGRFFAIVRAALASLRIGLVS